MRHRIHLMANAIRCIKLRIAMRSLRASHQRYCWWEIPASHMMLVHAMACEHCITGWWYSMLVL